MSKLLESAAELHTHGKLDEAELIYKKILDKFPDNPDALHLLGLIAYQRGQYEKAAGLIEKAIEIKSNSAMFYGNLGMVYDVLGRKEDSIKSFQKALSINDPQYLASYLAYYNLAVYFADKWDFSKALENYNRTIELKKDFFDAYWNKGLILLLLGKFSEGFQDYEYRLKKQKPTDTRIFNKPKWDGSFLNGKKILIVSEQGFGDAIQFSRYIQYVKKKGGYVILECRKELRNIFENLPYIDQIIDKEDKIPDLNFEVYIHLMSLPSLSFESIGIPKEIPYLKSNSIIAEKFSNRFDRKNFNIGICWAGNPEQQDDWKRSTTFEKFKSLFDIPHVKFFSLQKGEASKQINDSRVVLLNEIENFSDTAAIIENLDLVISVDTSIAHLAGAMGKPVWTLLSSIPDWRWLLEGEGSAWYPTMKLFRQKKIGDWDSVFDEVKEELRKKVNSYT